MPMVCQLEGSRAMYSTGNREEGIMGGEERQTFDPMDQRLWREEDLNTRQAEEELRAVMFVLPGVEIHPELSPSMLIECKVGTTLKGLQPFHSETRFISLCVSLSHQRREESPEVQVAGAEGPKLGPRGSPWAIKTMRAPN